jgi:hypothetical protein
VDIQQKIRMNLISSMKEKNEIETTVLRALITAFTNELVSRGRKPQSEVSDELATSVILKQMKQRRDSIEQYTRAGRSELAQREEQELKILEEYAPKMMEREEITEIARNKKGELKINDKSKIGILIGILMKDLRGKADGGLVKEIVQSLF